MELIKKQQQLLQHQETALKTFNRNLSQLVDIARKKTSGDNRMEMIYDLLRAINSITPEIIITNAGPYIWKYRDYVKNRQEEFFLKHDFEGEVKEYYQENEVDSFSQNEIVEIMDTMRGLYPSTSPQERELIWKMAQELLANYCIYIKCEREREILSQSLSALRK